MSYYSYNTDVSEYEMNRLINRAIDNFKEIEAKKAELAPYESVINYFKQIEELEHQLELYHEAENISLGSLIDHKDQYGYRIEAGYGDIPEDDGTTPNQKYNHVVEIQEIKIQGQKKFAINKNQLTRQFKALCDKRDEMCALKTQLEQTNITKTMSRLKKELDRLDISYRKYSPGQLSAIYLVSSNLTHYLKENQNQMREDDTISQTWATHVKSHYKFADQNQKIDFSSYAGDYRFVQEYVEKIANKELSLEKPKTSNNDSSNENE